MSGLLDHGKVYIACKPVSSKWRDIAARLGVLENTLATIEADYIVDGVERCMSAVIDKWLRRPEGEVADDGVLPSWRNLCVALSPIDRVLAEGIAVEHGCTIISPTVSKITKDSDVPPAFLSYSCGCGRCAVRGWMTCQTMCLYAVTQPKLYIVEPQFVQFGPFESHHTRQLRLCQETKYLIDMFDSLSSTTWNSFHNSLGYNTIHATDVARELASKLRINIPDLTDIRKIQDFAHMHNVNWFSFGLLYFLYNTFLREHCPDITAEWNTYLSLFKEYCSTRNIKDFIGIFFEVEDNNIFLIEIDESYYNFTLADVDSLRESLSIALDVSSVSLHLVTVKTGSVIIYFYYCYSDYLTRFKSLSSQQLKKIAMIKLYKILSLTDLYHQFEYNKLQSYYHYEDSSSSTSTELQLWKKQAVIKDIDLSKKEAESELLKNQLEKSKEKELELEKEMRKKSTIELEQLKGFRKIGKLLDGQSDDRLKKLSVTEDQFVEELLQEPNKDWYTLGFLLGLYETDTKEIAFTCRPKTIDACLRQIFRRLQSYKIKVTWEQIVDALSCPAMDNKELAERIRTKFCPDHHYQLSEKDVADHKRYMISNFSFGKRDDAGFVLVSDIIKLTAKATAINESDIRRVVAGDPQFTMDCNENGETKVRFIDNQKDIPPYVEKEKKIYYFVSKICRFGTRKELTFDEDGFVQVEDLLPIIHRTKRFPISSIDEARIYLERAVKYSTMNVLQLIDRQGHCLIRHVLIHPPEGPFKTSEFVNRWSTVRTLLCDELIHPPLKVEKDGYATVKDLLSHSRMRQYNGVSEGYIRKLVEETKDKIVTPNKFELKEGPPLMIRAKFGHTIKGVSVYDRKLSLSDPETKFVVCFVLRRSWVVTKKQGIHVDNMKANAIELRYSEQILSEEQEIREEYDNLEQIVVINMERAINDGLEFWVNSPKVIACKSKVIAPKYFEKIF